jgi:hypothetical protein
MYSVSFVIGGVAQVLDFTSTATNTNCTDIWQATITVVASGGTVNYKYVAVISGSTPLATAYGSSNTLVVDTNGGANMAWDVYVMDAGCFITKPQTIVLVQSSYCFGSSNAVSEFNRNVYHYSNSYRI